MKDTQILSSFVEPLAQGAAARPLVFDACSLGVVLRAVLAVLALVAVGAMFGATSLEHWLMRLSLLSAAVLPATLGWLVVACGLKRLLALLTPRGQQVAGVLLGAVAGLYASAMMEWTGVIVRAPWVGGACSGALIAGALVAALELRARGRTPAETAARLSELQARIRPHFLFNTLNSAIALVREDPERAETILEDLSDLFRYALMEQGEAVSLAEEIQLARRYLDIEQVRFGERLEVEWAIDPAAASARVPPLVLQPLVENAVKHGVEPSATGAQVKVSTQRRGNVVIIRVTNTVPGGQGEPGHGVAQENVRKRLGLLHDVQGQFHAMLKDGVYQVRLEVPV